MVASIVVIALYLALAVPFAWWPHTLSWTVSLAVGIYSFVAAGLAVELAEALLALTWKPTHLPQVPSATDRQRAAVVMTVRDDTDTFHLVALGPLALAGYRVFVLDDSRVPLELPAALRGLVTLVRRGSRRGAKAGNLNHWLGHFGCSFEYCILLDADSLVTPTGADELIRAADHPENAPVAVFQSKILPHTVGQPTWLQRILGVGGSIRARIHARVHARLGVLLSFGHNQLLRLSVVRALEGFDEERTAEDTVFSLRLAALGHRIGLVDTWTYDTDPASIEGYVRRTTRWARQTVELFRDDWGCVPLRLKLTLCWHLLSYALPAMATLLLLVSIWSGPRDPWVVLGFSYRALCLADGFEFYGLAMWPGIGAVTLKVALHVVLARMEHVRLRAWAQSFVLGGAIQALLVMPLAVGMLASAIGRTTSFEPTNARPPAHARYRSSLSVAGALAIFGSASIGLAFRPGAMWVGFNWFWCIGLLAVPVIVVRALRDNRTESSSLGDRTAGQTRQPAAGSYARADV
jgi:cellulose synthase/poly-beta-1,6-N-acetylglucosamine synthase-like glycosyltransferase